MSHNCIVRVHTSFCNIGAIGAFPKESKKAAQNARYQDSVTTPVGCEHDDDAVDEGDDAVDSNDLLHLLSVSSSKSDDNGPADISKVIGKVTKYDSDSDDNFI